MKIINSKLTSLHNCSAKCLLIQAPINTLNLLCQNANLVPEDEQLNILPYCETCDIAFFCSGYFIRHIKLTHNIIDPLAVAETGKLTPEKGIKYFRHAGIKSKGKFISISGYTEE